MTPFLYHVLQTDINDAIENHDIEKLEKAIRTAEEAGLDEQLSVRLELVNSFLAQLQRLRKLRHPILELNQATIAEIKSYSKPPEVVHKVMKATFIVLGDNKDSLMVNYMNINYLTTN